MRILVADQNAQWLAAIASTFGRHCVMVTETRRDACLDRLTQERFDVIVACEKLRDCTGLELLSEVQTLSPHTLCIFSAPTARLAQMKARLDHFDLLGTLSYPIDPHKLLLALKVARAKLGPRPKVRHVVLQSEWGTGERPGSPVKNAGPPTLAAASAAEVPVPAQAEDIPVIENMDETSVSGVRRVQDVPSADVPSEVTLEANPRRIAATGVPAQGDHRRNGRVTAAAVQAISSARAALGAAHAPSHAQATADAHATMSVRVSTGTHSASGARSAAAVRTNSKAPASTRAPSGGRAPAAPPSTPSSRATPGGPTTVAVLPPSSPGRPIFADESQPDETLAVTFNVLPGHIPAPANDASAEEPPPPPPPPPPPVDTGGAANDPAYENGAVEKAPAKSGSKAAPAADKAPKPRQAPTAKKKASGTQPRKPSMPTAAQREAFQRAVARRNAARRGEWVPGNTDANGDASLQAAGAGTSSPGALRSNFLGTDSLSDLARKATSKRPLTQGNSRRPPRKVFVVGSGIAAVLLASVLAFELTTSHPSPTTHHGRQAVAAQLFSPKSDVVTQNPEEPIQQVFGAPPSQPGQAAATAQNAASNIPLPQAFDPNTSPDDPPPPPALEHPGPVEPPSSDSQ